VYDMIRKYERGQRVQLSLLFERVSLCHKHFQVKDAIVHLLNQRDDKKESWISFSTGKIMRPDISEI
ncbi:MAG: hypothetical protein ACK5BL_08315, partial [Flavobacteriales bacterium]